MHKNNIFNVLFIVSIIFIFLFLIAEQIDKVYSIHLYTPLGTSEEDHKRILKPWGKFIAYENSTIQPETELKGIVVGTDIGRGNWIYIVPDENYHNLLIDGNIIYPDHEQLGYENYVKFPYNYKVAKGIPTWKEVHPPIIKLETYEFCKDFDCTDKYEDALGEGGDPLLKNPDGSIYEDKSYFDIHDIPNIPEISDDCKDKYNELKNYMQEVESQLDSLSKDINYSPNPAQKSFSAKQIQKIYQTINLKYNELRQCIDTDPAIKPTSRIVKPGDHIKVEGLYAIDYGHTIYYGSPSCEEKFAQQIWPKLPTEWGKFKEFDEALSETVFFPFRPDVDPNYLFSALRGIIDLGLVPFIGGFFPISMAIDAIPWPMLLCYSHAELHPYKPASIRLIEPLKPGDVNQESHIVAAPIPTQYISLTNAVMRNSSTTYGELDGPLSGRLVDFSTKKIVQSEFFMEAPPKPVECNSIPQLCVLKFKEDINNLKGPTSDPIKDGYIDVKKEFTNNPKDGVKVIVTVKGEDILNPTIYSAKFSVWWEQGIIG